MVEILANEGWVELPFEDIKKGYKFRYLYNQEEFVAGSDAYWEEESSEHVVNLVK